MRALMLLQGCCLILYPSLTWAEVPPGYVRARQVDGVTVYRRQAGQAVDLYAEGLIAASPERVRAVLLDYTRHPTFMKHEAEVRILTREPAALLVYQRLKLPVIKDRDMVLAVTWGASGALLWTHFKAVTDRGPPPRGDAVRVTDHEGGWRLTAVEGGRATYAQYQMRIDLGGSLPSFLARAQGDKDVPELFSVIQKQALLPGTGTAHTGG